MSCSVLQIVMGGIGTLQHMNHEKFSNIFVYFVFQLQVTETISKELTFKALLLSIEQVTRYGNMYKEGVIEFKVSEVIFISNQLVRPLTTCGYLTIEKK